MNKGIVLTVGILAIFLVGFLNEVSAFAVGASPATLSFTIPRGGYEEKTFQVSTNSEIPLEFSISMSSSINAYIEIETEDRTTVSGKPAEVIVRAHSSRSAEPANIDGAITTLLKPSSETPEGSGSVVSTGVAVRVNIEITDETAPLIKNKLAFVTVVLVAVLVLLISLYLINSARQKNNKK